MQHPARFPPPATDHKYGCLALALVALAMAAPHGAIAAGPTVPVVVQSGGNPGSRGDGGAGRTALVAGIEGRSCAVAAGDSGSVATQDVPGSPAKWNLVLGEVQAVMPTNPSVSVHANPFAWVPSLNFTGGAAFRCWTARPS